jgi:peroxiredoxin
MQKMLLRGASLLFILISTASYAQPGYKFDFKIKGLKDTVVFLGYYNADKTYVRDTATVNSSGVFSFDGPAAVPQGMYMVAKKNTTLITFVAGADQRFLIETDTEDYIAHVTVTGDEDNKLFFENANFLATKFKQAEPYTKILRDSTANESAKKPAREEFQKLGKEVKGFQGNIITKYPTTFTARFLKSTLDIEVPEAPKRADGTIDSTWQFRYYRDHYWDNYDLGDEGLLHVPRSMYQEKVKDYLDRLFIQSPDTLTKEIVRLAGKAKKTQETYKYFIWTCLTHYQQHKIMGLDEVYVNVYDKFVASGELDFWLDNGMKKSIKDYVDKIRLSLVGGNAPNLIMQDQNLKPRSMYDIKSKYTILFFFSPDCGHCKEETPKLVEFYNKNKAKFDIEVYAVSIDTSMAKMKSFIKDFKMTWPTVNGPRTYVGNYSKLYYAETTPTIYIIDSKHKIIGKKLGPEQFEEFFEKYDQAHQPKPVVSKGK